MDGWGLEALKYGIVIVFVIGGIAEIKIARLKHGTDYAWIKFGLGIILFYWAGYYLFSIIRSLLGISLTTHQIFVRAGIFMTGVFITAGALKSLVYIKRGLK